jgi:processive 1,2-diacylglycerol beta-glucosyltransferase
MVMDERPRQLPYLGLRATLNGRPGPRPPRILIASASVGAGHLRAAQAIELALRRLRPDAMIRNVDVLTFGTRPFRWSYSGSYRTLVRHAPQMLAWIYNRVDRPPAAGPRLWYRLRVYLEKLNLRPFLRLLTSEPWDLVVNTFFLSGEIVASLRRQGRLRTPQVMVTTDFEVHRNWVTQPCDHYFTATEEAAQYLRCFGVPAGDVRVTGVPIHAAFSEPKDQAVCRQRHGLSLGRPVLLLLVGGGPLARGEAVLRALLDVAPPADIVAVTGRNTELRERLSAVPVPARHRARVLGFTDQMDELLAAADLVVTKPGGLTASEALARGTGIVIINPIPGQEERNSDYLLENGAAVKGNHLPTLAHKLNALLRDPARLAALRANARRLGRPRAALDVAEQALALLDGRAAGAAREMAWHSGS